MGLNASRLRGGVPPVDLTTLTATDNQGNVIGGIVGVVVGLAELVRQKPDVTVDAGQLHTWGIPEAVCESIAGLFHQPRQSRRPFEFKFPVEGQDDLVVSITPPSSYSSGKIVFGKSLGHLYFNQGKVTDFYVGQGNRLLEVEEFAQFLANTYPRIQPFLKLLLGLEPPIQPQTVEDQPQNKVDRTIDSLVLKVCERVAVNGSQPAQPGRGAADAAKTSVPDVAVISALVNALLRVADSVNNPLTST
jgi:hypothetical protein